MCTRQASVADWSHLEILHTVTWYQRRLALAIIVLPPKLRFCLPRRWLSASNLVKKPPSPPPVVWWQPSSSLDPPQDQCMLSPSPVAKQLKPHRLPPLSVVRQLHQRLPSPPARWPAVFKQHITERCLPTAGLASADIQTWDCITPTALQAAGALGSQEANHPHRCVKAQSGAITDNIPQ